MATAETHCKKAIAQSTNQRRCACLVYGKLGLFSLILYDLMDRRLRAVKRECLSAIC